jgi:uncharacterized protein (TIGR00266 family)
MEIDVQHGPANAAAKITLGANEQLTAEAGAMIAMSADMGITTTTHKKGKGSIGKALKRMLSGESFFMNHFTAGPNGGEVWVSPTLPGDVLVQEITPEMGTLIVQGGSYLCSSTGVDMDMSWQGFKSFLSGESIFWIKLSGQGTVALNSFGAIYPVEVDGAYVVDTGHIVAFPDSLDFSISKAGKSWLSSFLGGEGLVTHFKGKGTMFCQSHNPVSFGKALGPSLRPVERG